MKTAAEELHDANRLKAIELIFKLLELQANPAIKDLTISKEIQKFIVDLANDKDNPVSEFPEYWCRAKGGWVDTKKQ